MRTRILVMHGPNLQRLGRREPDVYGRETLDDIHARLRDLGSRSGADFSFVQSNHEGALLDALYAAVDDGVDGVIVNAGAYAHTSLALADAIRAIAPVPVVEVHLSNTVAREGFRHAAVVGAACLGRVEGFGASSYVVALTALLEVIDRRRASP